MRSPATRPTVRAAAGHRVKQGRQHGVAQVIAVEAQVGVRRVLHPGEATVPREPFECLALEAEQRSRVPGVARQRSERRHARDRAQPAAAQPLQQHRLELVVRVVGGEQHLARREPLRNAA